MYQPRYLSQSVVVVGISYRNLPLNILGQFSFNRQDIEKFYSLNKELTNYLILSTCNRVEVWGYEFDKESILEKIDFTPDYILEGEQAFIHMCRVGAGMDSQVIGEVEVLGQLRESIKLSKEGNRLGKLEDITNTVIYLSRKIRTETQIDKGVVTIGGVVSKYLEENIKDLSTKKVLILGLGKTGRNILKWITDYNKPDITVTVNRTPVNGQLHNMEDIKQWIHLYDITIVCTDANTPILNSRDYEGVLLDLSVPHNVEGEAIRLEELNKVREENVYSRLMEVERGEEIIAEFLSIKRRETGESFGI